ncbi:MAG: MGDG synthase family glycosyltransferase [Sarcina sp.]
MSKILILTTATGEGHNQAARSLKEILKTKYDEVEIFDFLETSKAVNEVVVGGYELSAKIFPYIYGFFYKISNFKLINRFFEFYLKSPIKKTIEYVNETNPDVIACTHPLAVSILGHLVRKNLIDKPTVSIITDFKPHYTYFSPMIDAYITGSDFTKTELISFGVEAQKIYPVGIPVSKVFYEKNTSNNEINEYFNILVMGGSMGLSGISKVLAKLATNNNNIKVTIICGKNINLKTTLEDTYKNQKNFNILGYTNEVSKIMGSMDLIITKPGGLTTTESIHKGLPMIIPFVIPGQETDNSKFLVEHNAAIRVRDLSKLNSIIDNLIHDKNSLLSLKNNMKDLALNYSIDNTVDIFKNLYKKKSSK